MATFPHELLQGLVPIEGLSSIDRWEFSFAASWARQRPSLLFWGCAALTAAAGLSYYVARREPRGGTPVVLAMIRATLLSLLLILLAEPVLTLRSDQVQRPWLWLLFDGTESMEIADNLTDAERQQLFEVVGPIAQRSGSHSGASPSPTRLELVQAFLRNDKSHMLRDLQLKYRLKSFVFDRPEGIRELAAIAADETGDPEVWAEGVTARGSVTALGSAFADVARRKSAGRLAGILIFSDFDQNAGPPALEPATRLQVPLYTVGVGAASATDVAVDLRLPLFLKQGERATLLAVVHGSTRNDETVSLRITAEPLEAAPDGAKSRPIAIGEQHVVPTAAEQIREFTWVPERAGRYLISADVPAVAGEVVLENNHVERAIDVRDDFLRLLFVEFEPTWEWRFIKEVFHRDALVGQRGFRTFLRSADPQVRQNNELFLPQLTPSRSEFFANDVIFLGDIPAGALSARFCEMTEEFVSRFGGGLVIVSGPRFGPAQFAGTRIEDMLPVVVERGSHARDSDGFRLQLTPEAAAYDFMHLGSTDEESAAAWANLGALSWYQPVARPHPLAVSLATHPTDTCADGRTRQPLIAIRRYGKGEVIYLGFNETWRLRRKFGERHYRQLWGQMIHRLGLAHALGNQKRFVLRTDRQQYEPDDEAQLTVEAYDENFEPLPEGDSRGKALAAEWVSPAQAEGAEPARLKLAPAREGAFETRFFPAAPGEHRIRVVDPVTGQASETSFHVANTAIERRSIIRNVDLQEELARSTGGRSYDLTSVSHFKDDFDPPISHETTTRVVPLWDTWIAFSLGIGLMLTEWLVRKLHSLP